MKAVEHVKRWHEFYKDQPDVWKDKPEGEVAKAGLTATAAVCLELIHEMQALIIARRVSRPDAVGAIITEINQKWISICRKLNTESAGEAAFMAALDNVLPDVYEAYQAFLKSQGAKLAGRASS